MIDDSSFELVGRGPAGSIRLSLVEHDASSEQSAPAPKEERRAKRDRARARRGAKRRVRVAFREARRDDRPAPSPEELARIAASAEREAGVHASTQDSAELRIEFDDGHDSAVLVVRASDQDSAPAVHRDRSAEREARRHARQARKAEKLEQRAADLERRAAESRHTVARRN